MPKFKYRALTSSGEQEQGQEIATNKAEVTDRLYSRGLIPVSVTLASEGGNFKFPSLPLRGRKDPARRRQAFATTDRGTSSYPKEE